MTDGRVAPELDPGGKSAEELGELWRNVSASLRKQGNKAVKTSARKEAAA